QKHIQYDLLGHTHWTKKDRYDVGIDGHRYDIKGFHIGDNVRKDALQNDTGWLLDCCALVPSDQLNSHSLKDDDIYVFPFLLGDFEKGSQPSLFDQQKFRYIIHPFWDYEWFKNYNWQSLGTITIVSKCSNEIYVRIGGQGANHEF